jgi:hypothetical protein
MYNAKVRNKPKGIEKQMSTSIRSTVFIPMCIWPWPAALAIIPHVNHWCSIYTRTSSSSSSYRRLEILGSFEQAMI